MKSKIAILSLMLAGAAASVTAQTKEMFYSESFKDNIFVSVGVGGQVCVNPDNSDYGLGKAITPLIHVSVGKLFNPTWGVRAQVAGMWSTLNSKHLNGVGSVDGQEVWYKIKNKRYFTLRADAMYNLTNAIVGYNPDRLFSLSVFAGPGLTFAKTYGEKQDKMNALINGSLGLAGQFNVSKCIDINVEARGEVSPSIFGKYSSAYTDGAVSLTAGITYTFGGKNFTSCGAKVDQSGINDELNKYRSDLSQTQADLAAAKNALNNVKPTVKEVVKETTVVGAHAIFFKLGKSVIDDYGMVNIKLAAKLLKANPNLKYKVAGYADKATGNAKLNQNLSEKRAQAVYDALIKEGVSKDQLELVGFGGTADMFGKSFLNRVVLME
ncbi:MAG: OmpA family protein [Bacteroides sp.]